MLASSSSSKPVAQVYEMPWIEKYRPQTLREIVGNQDAVERLAAIAKVGNLPNIILAGPPGTGKTTSVLCLAREMLGEGVYKQAVLELNASDARGIDVIRNKIKLFAQKKVSLPPGRHKLIILDEADSMTTAAQQALRRIMEIYSNTTRFALACNNSTKIIEPLQSRCAVLRYTRLSDAEVLSRLEQIVALENIQVSSAPGNNGLEAIVFIAEGDLRQALNALQSTVSGFNLVTAENVFKVCDQPQPIKAKFIIDRAREGRMREALNALQELMESGYSSSDIFQTLFRVTRSHREMAETEKLDFLRELGFSHMRIAEGLGTKLQLTGCLARLAQLNSK